MSELNHFNIFYSWQSDLPKAANNYFIKECIERAVKELSQQGEITLMLRLDKDTARMSGSPKITETILSKIDVSNIFIADISIINQTAYNKLLKKRLTPNPNVLFELGYALNRLSWERIICLNNDSFSNIKNMPFDLQQNRISQYKFDGQNNKDKAKDQLKGLLKIAIKSIIDNNDIILSKLNSNNILSHDTKIFREFNDIIDDIKFIDKLNEIGDLCIVQQEDYILFRRMIEYLNAERNQFLKLNLKAKSEVLSNQINRMYGVLAANLFYERNTWYNIEEKREIEEISYRLPREREDRIMPDYEEMIERRTRKIIDSIDATINEYKIFRAEVKKELFI